MKYIRGTLALIVGPILFMLMSTLMLVTGVVTLGLARPFLAHSPMWMGQVMLFVVYRGILGMKIVVERDALPAPDHKGGVLAIANHPTMLLMMLLGAFFQKLTGPALVFPIKLANIWNPFTGLPILATGLGVFIDRSKGEESRRAIRRAAAVVRRRKLGIGILADQSRPTTKAIAADHKRFADNPNIENFRYTCVPRTGGVFAAFDAMVNPVVFVVMSACSVRAERWADIFGMVGSTYLIRVTRYESSEIPRDLAARRGLLERIWLEWNKRIGELQGEVTG